MPAPLIPVYRKHQPTFVSPCFLGEPCHTCAIHAQCQNGHPCKGCRRGKPYQCERAYPAPPAFVVRFRSALQLVRDGAAVFIHQKNALQLTFATLTYLRDVSCNVDGNAIWEYIAGSHRVRLAVNLGWRTPIATVTFVQGGPDAGFETPDETDTKVDTVENQQMYSASFEA